MTVLPHLTRYSQNQATKQTTDQDQEVTGSVIWLHGLGASGHDFEPLVPHLGLKSNIRFIFPHAPQRPVTINGGLVMPSWYDILSLGEIREVDWKQVEQSVADLEAFLKREEEHGIPSKRVVLAGFSQGGAITLQTALHLKQKLAGIMALSTYLFAPETIPNAADTANSNTPILMHHGLYDPVVPLTLAERSQAALKKQAFAINWQTWPMQHGVCPEQIAVIGQWLRSIFDAQ